MEYWIKPFRFAVDFEEEEFIEAATCPRGAIHVDLLSIEPDCAITRRELRPVHMRPCSVLHLSAWDAVLLVTVLHMSGKMNGKLPPRFYRAFLSNPQRGLDVAAQAGLALACGPDNAARVQQQIASRPHDWHAFRAAARQVLA